MGDRAFQSQRTFQRDIAEREISRAFCISLQGHIGICSAKESGISRDQSRGIANDYPVIQFNGSKVIETQVGILYDRAGINLTVEALTAQIDIRECCSGVQNQA